MTDLGNVLIKCARGKKVDRNDECTLFHLLEKIYGGENVLTEIKLDDEETYYFGCAIRQNGKWKVYNLIGTGGVVVKFGKRFALCVKAG